jgi:transcriptional regulator GlxA family with amidase domain
LELFGGVFRIHDKPHQYLIHRRIERAKELLRSSDFSVTEVCFAVGYQSLGSFTSLFHRSVGQTPAAYREWVRRQRQSPARHVPACFLIRHGADPTGDRAR